MTATLALTAAALYAAGLAILALLHLRFPGHRLLRDPVSDYGVGASKPWFQAMGWAGSVAGLLLAWAMARAGLPGWIAACLAGSVAARLGVTAFPTDLEGAAPTAAGRLHMLFAVVSFALYYTVVDNATPLLAASAGAPWAGVLAPLRWLAAASLAALVACLVLRPLRAWFGLAERIFLIAIPLWFLAASLVLAAR